MSLPDNVLSTTSIPFMFTGGRSLSVTKVLDFEKGGIAINDASMGLLYQTWRARLIKNDVVLDAPSVPEFIHFTATGISEISFTFDQNMRPALAYVQDGTSKLRWWDSTVSGYDIVSLPAGSITPRVSMDDKRASQSAISDIILAYIRSGTLYYRQQRDRFLTERSLATGLTTGLIKIGMNNRFRMQFMLEIP